jgi:hypothetical protein
MVRILGSLDFSQQEAGGRVAGGGKDKERGQENDECRMTNAKFALFIRHSAFVLRHFRFLLVFDKAAWTVYTPICELNENLEATRIWATGSNRASGRLPLR